MSYKNLFDRYAEFTAQHEAPDAFHRWCLMAGVSSLLAGRCWTTLGYSEIYTNMYICLVGAPAVSRKSAAIGVITSLLKDFTSSEDARLKLSSESLTKRRLIEELSNSAINMRYNSGEGVIVDRQYMHLLTIASELEEFLNPKDEELPKFLLNMFDGREKHDHSTMKDGLVALRNVSLSILGAVTPAFLEGKAFQDKIKSGFSSRFIFVYQEGRKCNNADPTIDTSLKKGLMQDLDQLINIKGHIQLSKEAKETYNEWYSLLPLTPEARMSPAMQGFHGRRHMLARKISLILYAIECVYDQKTRQVGMIMPRHVQGGIDFTAEAQKLQELAYRKTGSSPDLEEMNAVTTYFKDHVNLKIPKQKVIASLKKDVGLTKLDLILKSLTEDEKSVEAVLDKVSGNVVGYIYRGTKDTLTGE